VIAHSKLVQTLLVGLWPDTILAGNNDLLGIQCISNGLVRAHESLVVPIVRLRNLIHSGQMSAILAPTVNCAIYNQYLNEPVSSSLGVEVNSLGVEVKQHNTICCI
jgi:hypothetical protein